VKDLLQKAIARGDQAVNEIAGELLANETFSAALEKAMLTKGMLDRKISVVLNSMNLASKVDLDEVHDELRKIRREIRELKREIRKLSREREQ